MSIFIANKTLIFISNDIKILNVSTNSQPIYIIDREEEAHSQQVLLQRLFKPCPFKLSLSRITGRGRLLLPSTPIDLHGFIKEVTIITKAKRQLIEVFYQHHFLKHIETSNNHTTYQITNIQESGFYYLENFTIHKKTIHCKLENMNILELFYPFNIYEQDYFIGLQ